MKRRRRRLPETVAGASAAEPSERISLCMIVKNEEKDLGECIESARGAFDEAIIVDTGSTDHTKNVAAALGANVIDFPWIDDFAAARNCALNAATGGWVLVLDADERLSKDAAAEIRRAVALPAATAFSLEIVSDVGGPLPQRVSLVRLFRNDPRIRYVRRLHESVNDAIYEYNKKNGTRTASLAAEIHHHGYVPERFVSLKKRERNLRLHELTVRERPGDAYAWYRYGDELRAVDRAAAMDALRKAWDLFMAMPADLRSVQLYAAEIPVVIGWMTLDAGDAAGALKCLIDALPITGATPNFIYVRALAFQKLGRHRESLADFLQLLSLDGQKFWAPVQPGITSIIARIGAAECYEKLGDDASAAQCLRAALLLDPKCGRAAFALAWILHRGGEPALARRELDVYLQNNPRDGAAWALSGKFALEAGAAELAVKRLSIAGAAADAPDSVHADLAFAHAMAGNYESAVAAFGKIRDPRARESLQQKLAGVR
ncbi:MAG: glycosyltransferase [Planctomycetes bacterium]|nr:glycosyltransferase [Planctomycetota bacterium]